MTAAASISRSPRPGLGRGCFRPCWTGGLASWTLGRRAISALPGLAQKAAVRRLLLREGRDSIEEPRALGVKANADAASALALRQCGEAYIGVHEVGWRNAKHARQWRNSLATCARSVMGAFPVGRVKIAIVMKALEPIWRAKTERTARARGRLEVVLDWASVRG
jgi:integrase-like protein